MYVVSASRDLIQMFKSGRRFSHFFLNILEMSEPAKLDWSRAAISELSSFFFAAAIISTSLDFELSRSCTSKAGSGFALLRARSLVSEAFFLSFF